MPNEMSARNIQLKTFSSILFQDMPTIFKNGKVHILAEIPGIKPEYVNENETPLVIN
jgi:hypothetical protein